jgi:hypothetical protein
MNTKFSTTLRLLAGVGFACLLALAPARAEDIQLADNAPDHYVVQKGDTLWAISKRFLKDPWRWPDIWNMNKDQIKNPHLIYPGNMVVLEHTAGGPRLRLAAADATQGKSGGARPTVKLSPQARSTPIDREAIPSIPPREIEPYLTRPLVIEANAMEGAPKIVAGSERRVALTVGNTAYASGMDEKLGDSWSVYRPGRALKSPGKDEVLGHEALFLGDVRVSKFGEASTLQIISAKEEIQVGDRLVPMQKDTVINYVPHAPSAPLEGHIIGLTGAVAEAGAGTVVTVDQGQNALLEIGHVLAVYRPGPKIDTKKNWFDYKAKPLSVPDERVALAFVFRVFDKVAYALLLDVQRPVFMGDLVRNP